MNKISADLIYTGIGDALKNHKITYDDDGTIISVSSLEKDEIGVRHFNGALCPGFINTHCHLELSHMKGKIPTGTGLIPFITSVVKFREFPQEQIDQAILDADKEMYDNGIVAVGDICNKVDTASCKSKSPLAYYSFVEMFDFHQASLLQPTIDQYMEVLEGQSDLDLNEKNLVPHAPYSVSEALFEFIRNQKLEGQRTISIHNQETSDENQMFLSGDGPFYQFYEGFGFNLNDFNAPKKTAIHFNFANLDSTQRNLFVHNTMTSREDILAAYQWSDHVYWSTCANANLYIENSLPDYQAFIDLDANMTIGTDSLSSNWQLSILEEMKTIKRYNSFIPTSLLFQWATLNGAKALGYEALFGSFEKDKKPGIIHLEGPISDGDIDLSLAVVNRII